MAELEYYSNIEYIAGWYYNQFPKFYNVECYRILSDFSQHPEKYLGVEESKESSNPADDVVELEDIVMSEDKNTSKKRGINEISSTF
mgnify:CR=1 FL=1